MVGKRDAAEKKRASAKRGPLFSLYAHIMDGRIVKRAADGKLGVVVSARHHALALSRGTIVPEPVRLVRWQGSTKATPVPDQDVQAWLTDRFANETWVPEPIRLAQLNGWQAPASKEETRALQQRLKQQWRGAHGSRRPAAAHARSVSTARLQAANRQDDEGSAVLPTSHTAKPIRTLLRWCSQALSPREQQQTPALAAALTQQKPLGGGRMPSPPASLYSKVAALAHDAVCAMAQALQGTPLAAHTSTTRLQGCGAMPEVAHLANMDTPAATKGHAHGAPAAARVVVALDEAVLRHLLATEQQ